MDLTGKKDIKTHNMTTIKELIINYPIPLLMMVGILIAAISTIIEENKRRKNKKIQYNTLDFSPRSTW